MKEPKRLLEEGSPLERSLLDSGRDEGPSPALEARILAAVAAMPRATDVSSKRPPADRPSGTWLRPSVVVGAALAIGAAAVVATNPGGFLSRGEAPPSISVPARATMEVPSTASTGPASTGTSSTAPSVTPDDLPNAPPPPASHVRITREGPAPTMQASATPPPPPAPTASTEREVELLDIVKAKLGAGAAADASRALDAYDAEFPRGTLRPEATVLRIRTLLLGGDRAAARKLADEFLATNPSSVHAKRVRSLLGDRD